MQNWSLQGGLFPRGQARPDSGKQHGSVRKHRSPPLQALAQATACRPSLLPRAHAAGAPQLLATMEPGAGTPRTLAAAQQPQLQSSGQEEQGLALSRSLKSVAELAHAWAEVSRRLPTASDGQGPEVHFEQIIAALKLTLASLQFAPPRPDGRTPSARAVQLASTLADLCAAGLPLDSDSIAAGILADAVQMGYLSHRAVQERMGLHLAMLVNDIIKVREAPLRIEVYDDAAASAVREWCLALHDVRANAVGLICTWDELQHMSVQPYYEQQALALEALQIYAPLGHALGLGPMSALMEDLCFKVLFPESYTSTSAWLRTVVDPAEDALYAAQQRLIQELHDNKEFMDLATGCLVKARTKSLFSIMKKLLRLGDASRGVRTREEIYDLLGMRAVVLPRQDLPSDQAEEAARQACYIVQRVASSIWEAVPERTKDYVTQPKANGYQSIHLTLLLGELDLQQQAAYEDVLEVSAASAAASAACLATATTSSGSISSGISISSSSSGTGSGSGSGSGRLEVVGVSGRESDDDGQSSELGSEALSARLLSHEGVSSSSSSSWSSSGGSITSGDRGSTLASADNSAAVPGWLCMELQIRTQAMDLAAESGEAAHTAYKGGLDALSARQLQSWTKELQSRLKLQAKGRLVLRAASATLADDPRPLMLLPAPRPTLPQSLPESPTASSIQPGSAAELAMTVSAAAATTVAGVSALAAGLTGLTGSSNSSSSSNSNSSSISSSGSVQASGAPSMLYPTTDQSLARVFSPQSAPELAPTATLPQATSSPHQSSTQQQPPVAYATWGNTHAQPSHTGQGHQQSVNAGSRPSPPQTTRASTTLQASGIPRQTSSSSIASSPAASPLTPQPQSTVPAQLPKPSRPTPPSAPASQPAPHASAPSPLHPDTSAASTAGASQTMTSPPGTYTTDASAGSSAVAPNVSAGSANRSAGSADCNGVGGNDEDVSMPDFASIAARQLFRHLDRDGDGTISIAEIKAVLVDLHAPAGDSDARALVAALDCDEDGVVSLQEFIAFQQRITARP